jgi:hypothetical protein
MMNPRFHLRLPNLSARNSTRFSVTHTPASLPSWLTPWGMGREWACTCSPLALLSQGKEKDEGSAAYSMQLERCPKEAIDNYASVARDTEWKEVG